MASQQQTNAVELINVSNVDTECSTIVPTNLISNIQNSNKYILSDVDQELLILVKFKQTVNLSAIKLYASNESINSDEDTDEDASPPKQIHIYKLQDLHTDFQSISSIKPHKSVNCSKKKLQKGQVINLKKPFKCAAIFAQITYLAIYIQSNQNKTEKTIINSIELNIYSDVAKQLDDVPQKTPSADLSALFESQKNLKEKIEKIKAYCESTQSSSCDKSPRQCPQIVALQNAMKNYECSDSKTHFTHYGEQKEAINILNNFNHLLAFHSRNDTEFDNIYEFFGGSCVASNCKDIKINYRNRNEPHQTETVRDIFSTIHCYIHHQYDIGCRLYKSERSQLGHIDESDEKFVSHNPKQNTKFIQMRDRLNKRRNKFKECVNITHTKFISNMNQVITKKSQQNSNKDENKDENQSLIYSYGFPFFYKDKLKDYNMERNDGYKYCDLYVKAKYASFKEELISNSICCIAVCSWTSLYQKAQLLSKTNSAKQCISLTGSFYVPQFRHEARHPYHFGYQDAQQITMNHLLAIRLYCEYDKFQRKVSETYRKDDEKETLKQFIERHSYFRHTAKYLKEAVQVFGTIHSMGHVAKVYHGVDTQMIIDSTVANIFGPLSTTSSWPVAVQFSSDAGMILELIPANSMKYISCDWISPYPHEQELFFIGGLGLLEITNIVTTTAIVYERYITALRIIETATHGRYLSNDPDLIFRLKTQHTINVSRLKLSPLTKIQKKLCLMMVFHQLAKNGYKDSNTHDIKLYSQITDNVYINQLLNVICNQITILQINIKVMNVNMLKQLNIAGQGSVGTYIGFLFLKPWFCTSCYEGINLNVLYRIFPNISVVKIRQLSFITKNVMEDILTFIENNKKSKVEFFELQIRPENKKANIEEKWNEYRLKFKKLGFGSNIDVEGVGAEIHCIKIMKIRTEGPFITDTGKRIM